MLSRVGKELLPFNPEPEPIIWKAKRRQRIEKSQQEAMVEVNQDVVENVRHQAKNLQVVNPLLALRDYVVPPTRVHYVIRRPTIQANNFGSILLRINPTYLDFYDLF